jgi:hypothetical protein
MRRIILLILIISASNNVFCQIKNDSICFPNSEHKEFMDSIKSARNEMIDAIEFLSNQLEEIELRKNNMSISSEENNSDLLAAGNYYALIIAVQNYESSNFPDLKHPISDAMRLRAVLLENYTFLDENIEILTDPIKDRVEKVLDSYSATITDSDNLLIFYAGHGGQWNKRNMDDGYWCPSDAEFEQSRTLINNSAIRDYLKLIESKNTLLISDACWAGSMMRDPAPPPNKKDVLQNLHDVPSRFYMSSGENTTVPDKSIFIKYLIKELKDNQDQYLRATDLFSRINNPVSFNTPRSDGSFVIPQFSKIHGVGHLGGDFIFIKK